MHEDYCFDKMLLKIMMMMTNCECRADFAWSTTAAFFFLGALIGAFVVNYLVERTGRRNVVSILAVSVTQMCPQVIIYHGVISIASSMLLFIGRTVSDNVVFKILLKLKWVVLLRHSPADTHAP
jgi:MFS family permease